MADISRTLILIKPDAFERGLTGEILARFERKGLGSRSCAADAHEEIANAHYAEHTEKPFFGELVSFITGGPLVAAVLEGHDAVAAARQLIGATDPLEAAPGSIRGEYGLEVTFNLVHGSDSDESAEREIGDLVPSAIAAPRLVLASASPRRREILERLGVEFEVVVPEVEELRDGDPGGSCSRTLGARRCAGSRRRSGGDRARGRHRRRPRGRLLGKPADEAARDRCSTLSGRDARGAQRRRRARPGAVPAEPSDPRSRGPGSRSATSTGSLDLYLASGEWRESAGAYAIQGLGSILIESIERRLLQRRRPPGGGPARPGPDAARAAGCSPGAVAGQHVIAALAAKMENTKAKFTLRVIHWVDPGLRPGMQALHSADDPGLARSGPIA